jgi:hypothetical protein
MGSLQNQYAHLRLRGPIDGRRFFSNSPIRSGWFVTITVVSLFGITTTVYLAISHWRSMTNLFFGPMIFISLGFAYSWLAVVLNYRRLRGLYRDALITDVEDGAPLDIALGVAAWAPIQALFYCYGAMILMEVLIGRLLTRVGM